MKFAQQEPYQLKICKMKNQIINIIIVGTGGQGVIWLSNSIRELAEINGWSCVGASFKGGAQKMGTVYSELRLQPKNNTQIISSQIPDNDVDVLIGLEIWETLRMSNRCQIKTKVIVSDNTERLYVERNHIVKLNPYDELKKRFKDLILIKPLKNKKLNELMLEQLIQLKVLPFNQKVIK